MDRWAFGITMTIVGVGGTFLTLWVLSLVVDLMKKLLPISAPEKIPEKNS